VLKSSILEVKRNSKPRKMAKITNAEVKTLSNCLEEICKRNAQLPVKVWYALSKNAQKLSSADSLTEKARIALVEKYGEKNGQAIVVPEDKMLDFQKELGDLLSIETDIDFHNISMSLLEAEVGKMQGVQGMYLLFQYIVSEDETLKTV
jgi:hypothetical protein